MGTLLVAETSFNIGLDTSQGTRILHIEVIIVVSSRARLLIKDMKPDHKEYLDFPGHGGTGRGSLCESAREARRSISRE